MVSVDVRDDRPNQTAVWRLADARRLGRRLVFICISGCTVLRAQPAAKPDTSQTLSIGMVIDTHPQQGNVIEFERQVVDSLTTMLAGTAADGFVISYSDHVQLVGDWTTMASGLTDAAARISLDAAASKERGAVLNDGLMAGLTKLGSSRQGRRRCLLVIGEGNDSGSGTTFSEVLRAAKDKHIPCFVVLVANHRSQVGRMRQFGFDLYRLASATGGKAYDVRTNPKSLNEALKDMLKRMAT
jgi:hypothetical protein